MNHPRRVRLHRLQSLVLPALLGVTLFGVAWLVRARLPHPPTEGDQWLWELGETAEGVQICTETTNGLNVPYKVDGKPGTHCMQVYDRQGLRNLFRSFTGTGPRIRTGKIPDGMSYDQHCRRSHARLGIATRDGYVEFDVIHTSKGYRLWSYPGIEATTNKASVQRFCRALQEEIARSPRRP